VDYPGLVRVAGATEGLLRRLAELPEMLALSPAGGASAAALRAVGARRSTLPPWRTP